MMFPTRIAFLATLLTITSATIITTPPPTTTLVARQTTSPTTSAIDFMTTQYITVGDPKNPHTVAIAIPTCIQTITPDKNGYVPPGTCNALYDYYPSFAAAVVASATFGVLTVTHIAQAAIYKKVS